ncbi:MAG: VOC family protein [Bacteroidota bacterium]|nr:VOC family protein [Bacteroidota bacterium]
MQTIELNHIAIHVKNVAESVDFYKNTLEFEQIPRPAFDFDGAWFRLGSVQELHILEGRDYEVQSSSRKTHFALKVASINESEQFLVKKKVTFRAPKQRPDGLYQIFVVDPDGYWIELCGQL